LVVTLAAAGVGSGILDVAINANAGRIESATGRRLMPLAHGLYSVGVLTGAVAAGLARGAGVGREPILLAVSVCVALTALAAATGLIGFAIAGAGVSLNAPIVFGLAGRRPDAANAVATVTTLGYLGLLVGPPLVGLVAQATSLRVSLFVLAVIAAAVAVAAQK